MKARPNTSRFLRGQLRLEYLECREVLSGFHNAPPPGQMMPRGEGPAMFESTHFPRITAPTQGTPAHQSIVVTVIVTTTPAAPTTPPQAKQPAAAPPNAKEEARSPEAPVNAGTRTTIATRASVVVPEAVQLSLRAEPALAELMALSDGGEAMPVFHGAQPESIALPIAATRDVRVTDLQLPTSPTAANLFVPPRVVSLAHDNGESLPFVPKATVGPTVDGLQTLVAQPNTMITPAAAAATVTPAPERAGLVTAVPLGRSAWQRIIGSFNAEKSESVPFRWTFCHWLAATTAALAIIVIHESTRRLRRKPAACRIGHRWMDELS